MSSELRAGYHFCGQRKQPIWAPIDSQLDLAHSKWLDGEEQARMGFGRFRGVQAGLEQRQGGRFPATVLYIVAAVGLCAATASAQTKVSGTAQFAKPDPVHMLPVGDRPDHSLAVEQLKCTWTKPMEIAGDKSKDGISTETVDITGNTGKARGFHVGTMESGDKFFVWYRGTSTLKEGSATGLKGNWGFSGGNWQAEKPPGQGHLRMRAVRRRAGLRHRGGIPVGKVGRIGQPGIIRD